jgi:formylglycine-generating enzyme required for sulfatase activity
VLIGAAAAFFVLRGKAAANDEPPVPAPVLRASDAAVAPSLDAASTPTPRAEDMVAIPAGTYAVTGFRSTAVAAFRLDKTEMTTRAYAVTVGEAAPAADGALPKREVTWAEAAAACASVGKRLPTELEWEYAATRESLDASNARLLRRGVDGPAPVGTHPGDCTAAGLCDLLGKVSEWVSDPWRKGARDQPDDTQRVVRGGSFTVAATSTYARPQSRSRAPADRRDPELGFRCARDGDPEDDAGPEEPR